jgi:hypothetical protein
MQYSLCLLINDAAAVHILNERLVYRYDATGFLVIYVPHHHIRKCH